MKTVLHITCDFPDPIVGAKTRGVLNFVENTPGFRHIVYSLNRANWKREIVALPFGVDRVAVAYGAPPKGVFLETRLRKLAAWIRRDLADKGIAVDLIHAHKLTVDGLVAHDIHRALGVPYICSIWGDTDLKIIAGRPDLSRRWRAILADAARVLPVAPWTADRFCRDHGLDRRKAELLLPIVQHETFTPPTLAPMPRLVTLFNLDAYRRKNLPGLVRAVVAAAEVHPDLTLDIYGSGNAETLCEIDALIRAAGAQARVRLKGRLPDGAFEQTLNGYTAFVMPTARETFGMVFVEALFCGLPVLYTRGWSIDGLFPAERIGYAWDGASSGDIAKGLLHLIANEAALKRSLAALAEAGEFDKLKRAAILTGYARVLAECAR